MNDVQVIIPALNEPYLPILKRKLTEYKVDVRDEKGFSYAVWQGIQNARNEIVVVMDGDGSHPPEAISNMIKLLDDKIWLVIGSRYCKGGYSSDAFHRKVISQIYCLIVRIILRSKVHDTMSCFWVGWKFAFQFKPSKSWRFGLQLIRNNGGHIQEFPIVFEKRKIGKSHIKPLQALYDLIAVFRE